jgi:hypothetical protein
MPTKTSRAAVATFKLDATLDELREELTKRVLELAQSGLINIDLGRIAAAGAGRRNLAHQWEVILYIPYCERCQTVSPQRLSCDPAEPVNPNNTVTFNYETRVPHRNARDPAQGRQGLGRV